jgi:peptide deformylase
MTSTLDFGPVFFFCTFLNTYIIYTLSFSMMNRSIQTGRDNQILRTASALVDANTQKQAQALARELVDWVKSNDTAVGLAAPQTGINLRVIACALGTETPDGYEIRRVVGMINPCIVDVSNEMCREEEACFSVP